MAFLFVFEIQSKIIDVFFSCCENSLILSADFVLFWRFDEVTDLSFRSKLANGIINAVTEGCWSQYPKKIEIAKARGVFFEW